MNWYKKANEFVGADATTVPQTIMEPTVRNLENQYLPQDISRNNYGTEYIVSHDKCEKCGRSDRIVDRGFSFQNSEGKKEKVYLCKSCKYTNYYTRKITKNKKKNSRVRKRRRAGVISGMEKLAASPAIPSPGYNNIMNTPAGRLDLSEDERIIPWSKLSDMFESEYDCQKQKGNDEEKVIKVVDKDGKIKFVRVKKRNTGGEAIQPSNVYNKKGRIKKQRRFKEDGRDNPGDNPGSWPNNRNETGVGSGGYQMPYSSNLGSDARERMTSWYDNLNNRGQYGLSRPY